MTVLTAIGDACAVIGLDVPTYVFASTEREHVELRALCNEIATRIFKEHDWSKNKTIATINGDGSTASFSLPSDFSRMLRDTKLLSSARRDVPLTHITDANIWLADQVSGYVAKNPEWMIYGGSLYIRPVVTPGEAVSYFYVKKVPAFSSDSDTFALDERLLTLGIIWQWKAQKGQPYAEDFANYEAALQLAIQEDIGPDIFSVGQSRNQFSQQYARLRDAVA